MIILLAVVAFLVLYACIPFVPFAIKNLYRFIVWGAIDIYYWFKYKKYNECPYYGRVDVISAYKNKVFGSGKTLDGTMVVRDIFKKYDGLEVWDDDQKKFVTQHVHVISNVDIKDIPYVKFKSSTQMLNVEQDSTDVTIFFFDEIGAVWNSRNYKDNISTELLKELLQCRKNKVYILGTSQRFRFIDVLLRQITGRLICVNKTWRVLKRVEYDPFEYENCSNISMLKPLHTEYKFIFNKDYAAYDTGEKVEDLIKLDLLPDETVVQNQQLSSSDLSVVRLKKRFRSRRRGK